MCRSSRRRSCSGGKPITAAVGAVLMTHASHAKNARVVPRLSAPALVPQQVEWLVMRAMSLDLVKGVMDEVERLVHVTWVQPRVLDNAQLARLNERLGEWRGRVDEAHVYVEEQTPELFG